jgi:hypothetical protein
VNSRRLLLRLSNGHLENVSFADAQRLVEDLGFVSRRQRGSHVIYKHPDIPDQLNLQPDGGRAKAYQLRQLMELVEEYHLTLGETP